MTDYYQDTIRLARLIGLDYQYDDKKRVVKQFAHQWNVWRPVAEHHPGWQWWGHRYLDDCRLFCQAVLAAFGEEETDKLCCAAMVQAFNKEAENHGPAIVTYGSVTTGFSFHGPFPTVTDAAEWLAEWLAGQAVFAGSVILPEPVDTPVLTSTESEVAIAELAGRLGEAETSCRLKEETIVRDIRVMASDRQRFEEELKTLRDRVARRDGYLAFLGSSAKGVREAQEKMAEQAKLIEQLKAELADAAITNDRLTAERDRLQRVAGMPSAEVAELQVERDQLAQDVEACRKEFASQELVIERWRAENKRCVDVVWGELRNDLDSARREVDEQKAARSEWMEKAFKLQAERDQLTADLAEKQALFDVQWTRCTEAEALWRAAHPGKENVLPDLGTLIGWLVRSQHLLDRITDGARWCGTVVHGIGIDVDLWVLPHCNGRGDKTLLEAASAGLSEEVSEEVSDG